MTEEFKKDNDYTISVVTETSNKTKGEYAVESASILTRTFNFLSAQVTTTKQDSIYQSRGYHGGGSSSIATQMFIHNFSDIQSYGEIKLMHAKLVEMGGTPPELSDIIPIITKGSGGWMQPG